MDMVELALARGAEDYQEGFEGAAYNCRTDIALRMWSLLKEPDMNSCVLSAYSGADPELMALFELDEKLQNVAVVGLVIGEHLDLLAGSLCKFTDNPSKLLATALRSETRCAFNFLVKSGIKCENWGDIVAAMRYKEYNMAIAFLESNPALDFEEILFHACNEGHLTIAEYILANHALSQDAVEIACALASYGRYKEIIVRLSSAPGFVGYDKIMIALCGPPADLPREKLALPGDSYEDLVSFCVENKAVSFDEALVCAAQRGCEKMIDLMLSYGADPLVLDGILVHGTDHSVYEALTRAGWRIQRA
jgi:hypothetical protein